MLDLDVAFGRRGDSHGRLRSPYSYNGIDENIFNSTSALGTNDSLDLGKSAPVPPLIPKKVQLQPILTTTDSSIPKLRRKASPYASPRTPKTPNPPTTPIVMPVLDLCNLQTRRSTAGVLTTESIHTQSPGNLEDHQMSGRSDNLSSGFIGSGPAEAEKKKKKTWLSKIWKKKAPKKDILQLAQEQARTKANVERSNSAGILRSESISAPSVTLDQASDRRLESERPIDPSSGRNTAGTRSQKSMGSSLPLTNTTTTQPLSPGSIISTSSSHKSSIHSSISSVKMKVKNKYEDHKARRETRKNLASQNSVAQPQLYSDDSSTQPIDLFAELPNLEAEDLPQKPRKKGWGIGKLFRKSKKHHDSADNKAVSFASSTSATQKGAKDIEGDQQSSSEDNNDQDFPEFAGVPDDPKRDEDTSTTTTAVKKKKKSAFQKIFGGGSKKSSEPKAPERTVALVITPTEKCLSEEEIIEAEKCHLDQLRLQTRDEFRALIRDLSKKLFIEHSKHYAWKHESIEKLLARNPAEKRALNDKARIHLEQMSEQASERARHLSDHPGDWKLAKGFADLEIAQLAQTLVHVNNLVDSIFSKSHDSSELMCMEEQMDLWLTDAWQNDNKTLNKEVFTTMGILQQNHAIVTHFDRLIEAACLRHRSAHYERVTLLTADTDRLHEHLLLAIDNAFDSYKYKLLELGGRGQPATDVNALLAPRCISKSITLCLEEKPATSMIADQAGEPEMINQILYRAAKRPKLPLGAGFAMLTNEEEWRLLEAKLDGRWGNSLILQKWLAAALEWQLMDVASQHQLLLEDRARLAEVIERKKKYLKDVLQTKLSDFWLARSTAAAETEIGGLASCLEDVIKNRVSQICQHDSVQSDAELMAMRYEDERMHVMPVFCEIKKASLPSNKVRGGGLRDVHEIDGIMATLGDIRKLLEDNHDLVADLQVQKYVEDVYAEIKACEARLKTLQSSTITRKATVAKNKEEALAKRQKLLDAIQAEEEKIAAAQQTIDETLAAQQELELLKAQLQETKKKQKEQAKLAKKEASGSTSIAHWFGGGSSSRPTSGQRQSVESSQSIRKIADVEAQHRASLDLVDDLSLPPAAPRSQEALAQTVGTLNSHLTDHDVDVKQSPGTDVMSPTSSIGQEDEEMQPPTHDAPHHEEKKKKKTIWRKIVGKGGATKKRQELTVPDNRSEVTDLSSTAGHNKKKQSWSRWFNASKTAQETDEDSEERAEDAGERSQKADEEDSQEKRSRPHYIQSDGEITSRRKPLGAPMSGFDSVSVVPMLPRSCDSSALPSQRQSNMYVPAAAASPPRRQLPTSSLSSGFAMNEPPLPVATEPAPKESKLEDSLAFSHADPIQDAESIFRIDSDSELVVSSDPRTLKPKNLLSASPSPSSLVYSPFPSSLEPSTGHLTSIPAQMPVDENTAARGHFSPPPVPRLHLHFVQEAEDRSKLVPEPKGSSPKSDMRVVTDHLEDPISGSISRRRHSRAHFHPNTSVVYVDPKAQFTAEDVLPVAEDLRKSSSSMGPRLSIATPSQSTRKESNDHGLPLIPPANLRRPGVAPTNHTGSIQNYRDRKQSSDSADMQVTSGTGGSLDDDRGRASVDSGGTWAWTEERDQRKIELERSMTERANVSEKFNVTTAEMYKLSDSVAHSELATTFRQHHGVTEVHAMRHDLWAKFLPCCCFNEVERLVLERDGEEQMFQAGAQIADSQIDLTRIYLILSGEVEYLEAGKEAEFAGVGSCLFEPLIFRYIYDNEDSVKTTSEVIARTDCVTWTMPLNSFKAICEKSIARVRQQIARMLISEPALSGICWSDLVGVTHLMVPAILDKRCVIREDSIYLVWQGMIIVTDLSNDRREQYYESDVFSRIDFSGDLELMPAPNEQAVYFVLDEAKLKSVTGIGIVELRSRRKDKIAQDIANMESVSAFGDAGAHQQQQKKKKKKSGISGVVSSTVKFLGGKKKHSSSRSAVGGPPPITETENLSAAGRKSL